MWKPVKYNQVKKVVVDDVRFDSKKEAGVYQYLKLMEKAGEIKDLILQPKFELQPGFLNSITGVKERAITYSADFQFFDMKKFKIRVVDVKGFKTDVYKLKRKMFDYLNRTNGIYIEELI